MDETVSVTDINGLELILKESSMSYLNNFQLQNFHVDRWKPININ